jgi:hypothetical protein
MIARVIVLFSFAVLGACTDAHDAGARSADERDEDEGSDEGAGSEDRDGGRGNPGAGADGGGTPGGGGEAGSSGGGTGQPVFGDVSACQPCEGAEGSMGALEPCCTADGECGLDIGDINGLGPTCAQQNAPGEESMSCPAYIFGGNFDLTSCCGADGACGVMIMQTAPLGCVDPRLLGDLVSPADENDEVPASCGGNAD